MIDALQAMRGMGHMDPDQLKFWASEDPAIYGQDVLADDVELVAGDFRQPHTIRGLEVHGMHTVADANQLRRF